MNEEASASNAAQSVSSAKQGHVRPDTVLLVATHARLAKSLRATLRTSHITLLSRTSADAALELVDHGALDLIAIDSKLEDMRLEQFCERVRALPAGRVVPIVVVGAVEEEASLRACQRLCVDDVITTPFHADIVCARLSSLARMKRRFCEALEQTLTSQTTLAALVRTRLRALADEMRLSTREREVLDLVVLGRSAAEMAIALHITERTAKFHVANLLRKLGLDSRLELFRLLV